MTIVKTLDFNNFFIKNVEFLQNKTQFVAEIYDENLTILAAKKLTIKKLSDLNKKIVNIISIGSSSALNVDKYFSKFNIKPKKLLTFPPRNLLNNFATITLMFGFIFSVIRMTDIEKCCKKVIWKFFHFLTPILIIFSKLPLF